MLVQWSMLDKLRTRVSAWCSGLDHLDSDIRNAAVEGATSSEMWCREIDITLRRACFIQGLANERIQTVPRARNSSRIAEAAESGPEEERALFCAKENRLVHISLITAVKMCAAATAREQVIRNQQCSLTSRSNEV
jgi:hypothetical protein